HEGKKLRWLGGTNYLSIGTHHLFQEKLAEGIKKFSQNWGSSRRNNLQISVWEELEDLFAKKYGRPAAALSSSGMLAGQTALQIAFQHNQNGLLNIAPNTHPALWSITHKPFLGTFDAWKANLQHTDIVAVDGTGSPWVEGIDFDFAASLSKENFLLVDESHRIGMQDIGIKTEANLIQTASLSKAFGIPAGIILGEADVIDQLKSDPFWVGSSPPNPAFCYACLHAQEAYEEQLEHLKHCIQLMNEGLKEIDTSIKRLHRYPTFCSSSTELFEYLKGKGFLTNQFSYPDINAPAICRATISSSLTVEDMVELIDALVNFKNA
ncbi:MAG: aminotransferase class I/II-fold pyridoxal phosphate-dependent enzyme, partial [Cytophagia bacterium]|nr:aminotransferase class I/II-fold pyridoxal phosphate-dependent enzyme [Cytophagia bacterium]